MLVERGRVAPFGEGSGIKALTAGAQDATRRAERRVIFPQIYPPPFATNPTENNPARTVTVGTASPSTSKLLDKDVASKVGGSAKARLLSGKKTDLDYLLPLSPLRVKNIFERPCGKGPTSKAVSIPELLSKCFEEEQDESRSPLIPRAWTFSEQKQITPGAHLPLYPDLGVKPDKKEPPSPRLKPLPSILRSKSQPVVSENDCTTSSFKPLFLLRSKSSSSTRSSCHDFREVTSTFRPEQATIQRSASEPYNHKKIQFNPEVWVREFHRHEKEKETVWYSPEEMCSFKRESMMQIARYNEKTLVPTGTGRCVSEPVASTRILFSHEALREVPLDDDVAPSGNLMLKQSVLRSEIRSVLLVDPHDILLKLFTKTLKTLMPHLQVTTAMTSEQALEHIDNRQQKFDLVIIEERLKLFHRQRRNGHYTAGCDKNSIISASPKSDPHLASGSALMRMLTQTHDKTLFIGVSAHLPDDLARFHECGADTCWNKPPPTMNQELSDSLLQALLVKRGQESMARKLFGVPHDEHKE